MAACNCKGGWYVKHVINRQVATLKTEVLLGRRKYENNVMGLLSSVCHTQKRKNKGVYVFHSERYFSQSGLKFQYFYVHGKYL